jgi:hypothetical protein
MLSSMDWDTLNREKLMGKFSLKYFAAKNLQHDQRLSLKLEKSTDQLSTFVHVWTLHIVH